ncbi:hypothetical protein J2X61_001009 [Bacillus sp. 3255]|nr:hypothetical protein [Bacillus sp. 3255]
MSIRKALFSISIGLLLTIFILGLMPFLVVFSWTETLEASEFYTSPIFFLRYIYKRKPSRAHMQNQEEEH